MKPKGKPTNWIKMLERAVPCSGVLLCKLSLQSSRPWSWHQTQAGCVAEGGGVLLKQKLADTWQGISWGDSIWRPQPRWYLKSFHPDCLPDATVGLPTDLIGSKNVGLEVRRQEPRPHLGLRCSVIFGRSIILSKLIFLICHFILTLGVVISLALLWSKR